jgi:adenylate kinase family enzyme
MKKILVIGNSGSGKTTFAKELAEKTGLPLVHLDKIFWCGEWAHISRDEFDSILKKELQKNEWIIDGDFSRTLPHRLKCADTVFYLDLPTITCLWGATVRVLKNFGKTRFDMGGNCPERFDKHKINLYKAIISYNKLRRTECYKMLSEQRNIKIIIFKSRRQINSFLKSIKK